MPPHRRRRATQWLARRRALLQRFIAWRRGSRLLREAQRTADETERRATARRAMHCFAASIDPEPARGWSAGPLALTWLADAALLADDRAAALAAAAAMETAVAHLRDEDVRFRSARLERAATIRGVCALREGDVEAALRHLADSMVEPMSDPARTMGPELELAMLLAEKGEVAPVKEYLQHYLACQPRLSRRLLEAQSAHLDTL